MRKHGNPRGEVLHSFTMKKQKKMVLSLLCLGCLVVRTMLEALISFLPTEGEGAIGALDWTPEERKKLAVEVAMLLIIAL